MATKESREIEFQGVKLLTCPNGCDEAELELGSDGSSFMAIMGKPYEYLRCGECGFGDENKSSPKLEMADVIQVWNETCSA